MPSGVHRTQCQLLPTRGQKLILQKLNPPSVLSNFLGRDRCQESPRKISKSGHWGITISEAKRPDLGLFGASKWLVWP